MDSGWAVGELAFQSASGTGICGRRRYSKPRPTMAATSSHGDSASSRLAGFAMKSGKMAPK